MSWKKLFISQKTKKCPHCKKEIDAAEDRCPLCKHMITFSGLEIEVPKKSRNSSRSLKK